MLVNRYISKIFNSNMYCIRDENSREGILIDPGMVDEERLLGYLRKTDINPKYVILTHEHFDHCAGVNILERFYDFYLLATKECAEKIKSDKGNLSRYAMEVINPFEIVHPVWVIEDLQRLILNGVELKFIKTPGHASGGMCILVENYLFSGDTLLETKVPVKLPGSNKICLQNSLARLREFCDSSWRVYPGHGDSFSFSL